MLLVQESDVSWSVRHPADDILVRAYLARFDNGPPNRSTSTESAHGFPWPHLLSRNGRSCIPQQPLGKVYVKVVGEVC